MLGFAHNLDYVVHVAAPYLIGVAVVLWAIAFGAAVCSERRRPLGAPQHVSRLFARAATGFLIIVLSLCAASVFLTRAALDEVRPRLNAAMTEIRVDGSPAPDPERLLEALRQIRSRSYHHSHPTTTHRIELQTAEGPLELLLRRDSTVPNEYWVFYSGFEKADDIGTVVTDLLD